MEFAIIESIIVISYLLNPLLGFILSFFLYGWIFLSKKKNFFEKILMCLLLSSPLYSISILGNLLHHSLSWCSMFLVFITIYMLVYIVRHKLIKLSKTVLPLIFLLTTLVMTNVVFKFDVFKSVIEIIQFSMMLVPLWLFYQYRDVFNKMLTHSDEKYWINIINSSIFALSICLFVQFILYNGFNIIVGNITFFSDRTVYDLFFNAYSVLSVYIGIGIVINYNDLLNKLNLISLLKIVIYILAIIINTSRTGIISAFLICILMTFIKFHKKKNKNMWLLLVLSGIILISMVAIVYLRGGNESIFDPNGRFSTYYCAFDTIFSNVRILFFGYGLNLNNYQYMIPHNFVLETWLTTGIFVTTIVLTMIIQLLKTISKLDLRFIIWHIFLSSMVITGFYATSFFTVFLLFSILLSETTTNNKKRGKTT